jgi:hypothetical protein
MNTLPNENLLETVKKQQAEEEEFVVETLDSKDNCVVVRMGCGASSHSNVPPVVHEPILHSQPAVERVEMMASGDSVKGSGGDGGKELIEKKAEREASGCLSNTKYVGDAAAATSSESSLPPAASLKQNEIFGSQEFCGASVTNASYTWTDEPRTLDEKITKLYDEIRNGTDIMSWDALSKKSAVLSNWLLALGIGQDSKKFIRDSFKDSDITLGSFKEALKKELEISRKLLWVAQTGLLRCIAESLPPAKEESDPLSGLRILDRKQVLELVQAMHQQLAECLAQSIADSPTADAGPAAGQCNNSKFCVDPSLFRMK